MENPGLHKVRAAAASDKACKTNQNLRRFEHEIRKSYAGCDGYEKTVEFYKRVLGLDVITDFGANKVLTGGLALQTAETYRDFIGTSESSFGSNNFEIYFEEDDFDKFADKLKAVEFVAACVE